MQRYFAKNINNEEVILNDEDWHHIKNVMRMKNNDCIQLVYNNRLFDAYIDDMNNKSIKIVKEIAQLNDICPDICLIIPALKEQKLDLILQKGTEIGINSFIIVPFERSMVKYDERKEKVKLERWKKICKEASEQSMRLDIPSVSIINNIDFVEKIDGIKLICSTNEKQYNVKCALKKVHDCDKITIVVGPEGGISNTEEAYYVSKGFRKITLGSQIMRVETVPIFLASVIKYELME